MELTNVVREVANALLPALPYLTPLGSKALEKAAEEIGVDVWEKAKSVWARLRPQVETKPLALEAFQDAALEPDDADAQAALRRQLKKLLAADPAFAQELAHLVGIPPATGNTVTTSGKGNVAIGGHATGNYIVTGDGHNLKS